MTIERIEIGDTVLCDLCNADWTKREESGGFVLGSKGVCPTCAPGMMADLKRYAEAHLVKAECPRDMSFANFIRTWRGPDAAIEIRSGEDFDLDSLR